MDEIQFIHHRRVLPVIRAKDGGPANPAWRSVWNPAADLRWPGIPLAIIDWSEIVKDVEKAVNDDFKARDMRNVPVIDRLRAVSTAMARALTQPIRINPKLWGDTIEVAKKRGYKDREAIVNSLDGVVLYGHNMWGSMAKKHKTIGCPQDLCGEDDQSWRGEDGVRWGRHYLADARMGACRIKGLKVKVLKPGEMWHGIAVHDGFHIWAEDIFEGCIKAAKRPPLIKFQPAKQSFQAWEKLTWEQMEDEALDIIDEGVYNTLTNVEWMIRVLDVGDRQRLLSLNPEMAKHPWIAGAIERGIAELMARAATNLILPSKTYVVIPSPDGKIHHQEKPGKKLLKRYPIDSLGNIRAIKLGRKSKYPHRKVGQVSLAGKSFSGKATVTPLPRSEMEGYDIVICSEDIKLAEGYQNGLMQLRSSTEFVCEDEMQLCILQVWSPECVIAIPYDLWVKLGGDYDGDTAQLDSCDGIAEKIWEAVLGFPEMTSYKIPKTKKMPIGARNKVIASSMANMVGMATNIASAMWALRGTEMFDEAVSRTSDLVTDIMERELDIHPPYDEFSMWVLLNSLIKIMTDGFKTTVDMVLASGLLHQMQGVINGIASAMPGWTVWMRSPWAFRHGLPYFEGDYDDPDDGGGEDNSTQEDELASARRRSMIRSAYTNATIARIYDRAKPLIESILGSAFTDTRGLTGWVEDFIKAEPAQYFIKWAPQCSEEAMAKANEFYDLFLLEVRRVNWQDTQGAHSSVQMFLSNWRDDCGEWADREFSGNRRAAAAAFWRISHMRASSKAGAGAVFMGFPEESAWVVEMMPGLMDRPNRVKTILVGFSKNIVDELSYTHYGPIRVQVDQIDKRVMFVALENQEDFLADREEFPDHLVGMVGDVGAKRISEGFAIPDPGEYVLVLNLPSKDARWHIAWLTPL